MAAPQPRGSLLRTVRAVAWSFLGLRRGSGLEQDARLNPVHVMVVGLVAVFLFVLALAALVHWIV
ncbi:MULTISPECIES: DUF2970 domain-containing protein [Xylophilus]|jgi:hypothetical protein|uniref:DUF2970 family protein n=1 Tax=Xylophilus ampelinus TaxID=54067 RepID=A0A318SF97_9BURK|nr:MULTISPECIES: DUF2970 domain-containing protein [Xylophilus]KQM80307.1 hypothetical protein ASE76_03975 [Xylophilus sp. Leaf220]MCS4511098.1 DUF2970 domain-containing protein [Xylophilus ampelinus]PYE75908.1 hypothetical protein DFQ15_11834 [Xylophilus ampelinus]